MPKELIVKASLTNGNFLQWGCDLEDEPTILAFLSETDNDECLTVHSSKRIVLDPSILDGLTHTTLIDNDMGCRINRGEVSAITYQPEPLTPGSIKE